VIYEVLEMSEETKNPVYHSVVLLVGDMERSKRFYGDVLGQKVVMDFGRNVGFEGGLAIWEREYALNLMFQGKTQGIKIGGNNAEIYFESGDVDGLYERLKQEGVKVIHSIIEQPWGQRVFRVYDPDNHILEFAESMASVVLRLDKKGFTLEEIAKKSLMPVEFINTVLQKK
jgi:catechol 2,3-dioxygenase-like lactoylglutathione lyase family enzyme